MEKYHEIRLDSQPGSKLPWIETTAITSTTPCPFTTTPGLATDDLKRELAFYTTALESTRAAIIEYKRAGIPFHRPSDYFAEMVKTDVHMARVRQSLVDESVAMKKSAEAKALREAKKYGKKVQVEKIKERHAAKRAELEKVQIAKRKNANADDEQPGIFKRKFGDDFDIEVDGGDEDGEGGRSKQQQHRGANNGRSNKRAKKDSKFGFGGRKRNIKSNTSDSTNDMSGFSQKKMKYAANKGSKGMKGSIKSSRPGKARRNTNRNKSR